ASRPARAHGPSRPPPARGACASGLRSRWARTPGDHAPVTCLPSRPAPRRPRSPFPQCLLRSPEWQHALGGRSVAVDFDQTVVADTEIVCDFVADDAAHLALEAAELASAETEQRPTEDRDLVRVRPRVEDALLRQRHALVEPEQRLSVGRLVLDD